jgi:hypothetical protein
MTDFKFKDSNEERDAWAKWDAGGARCPICEDLDDGDWLAICDCFMAERSVGGEAT